MASKGVIKTGEAFCMSCGATVDPGSERCESCYSHLEEEVRAFRCPRCGTVLELGTQQCPKCSMRFKVKTIRPSDSLEDDKILSKLIDWGKTTEAPHADEAPETAVPDSPRLAPDEAAALSRLLEGLSELADLRAEVASGMGTRLSEARERISRMMDSDPGELEFNDLESEISSVSQDMVRIDEVLSKGKELGEMISRTFSMSGPASLAAGRELSLVVPAGPGASSGPTDLAEREELLRKREEMVDRKIKAYAQKKKELEAMEAGLGSKVEEEPASGASDDRVRELDGRLQTLSSKVRMLHEIVSADGACEDPEPCLSSLEGHLRALVDTRSELEQRVAQLNEGEEELRALLKTLDGLLGQLPAEVIDGFSKTDEFKLYERVLDRLRI